MKDNDVLVIRPDYANILLSKNHHIKRLSPKRFKNSSNVDWSRCVFYFIKDETIDSDLYELVNKTEK
jgi:hypothetical protein